MVSFPKSLTISTLLFQLCIFRPSQSSPNRDTLETLSNAGYFYHGYPFGSEATYNPLSVIINGGYGIMQMGNRERNPFVVDYQRGWDNVWQNLLHPLQEIGTFGWKRFITTEVIPTSLKPESGQFLPNYQNHLIGGGMTYRMLLEWYGFHGYDHPKIWALSTVTIYHLLNEVVENHSFEGTNVDPIADMWIFNPLGILLFSSESVTRFFSETLHLRDWSYSPGFNPWTKTIENNGQNFSIKWCFPGQQSWSLFYTFGLNGIFGFSYTWANGYCLSGGYGMRARNQRKISAEADIQELTVDLVWNAGIYYDCRGSLLASLLFSGSRAYKSRLNIYPGLVRIFGFSPGLSLAVGQEDEVIFGLFFCGFPLGLAFEI